jgi:hypothetical protein
VSGPIARRAANAGLILVSAIPALLIVNLVYDQYQNRNRPPRHGPPTVISMSCVLRAPAPPSGSRTVISLRPLPPRIIDARCP